jgi:RNA-directed DNA polymerase
VHCTSERQARYVLAAITKRMAQVGLELHPDKTRIVYCKDSNRRGQYPDCRFDFLGYTFRPRKALNNSGVMFTNFAPAISGNAAKAIRQTIRVGGCTCAVGTPWRSSHESSTRSCEAGSTTTAASTGPS